MDNRKMTVKFVGVGAVIALFGLYIVPGGYEVFAKMLLIFVATYKNTISLVIAAILAILAILGIDRITEHDAEGSRTFRALPILGIIVVLILTGFTIAYLWMSA